MTKGALNRMGTTIGIVVWGFGLVLFAVGIGQVSVPTSSSWPAAFSYPIVMLAWVHIIAGGVIAVLSATDNPDAWED